MRGAFRKGRAAALAGRPPVVPYVDKRKRDGGPTWSAAFIAAWRRGDVVGQRIANRLASGART